MFKRACKGYWNLNVRMFNRFADVVEEHPWLPLLVGGVFVAILVTSAPSSSCQ